MLKKSWQLFKQVTSWYIIQLKSPVLRQYAIAGTLVVLLAIGYLFHTPIYVYGTGEWEDVTVTKVETRTENGKSTYYAYTVGKSGEYQNKDSWLRLKRNSSEVHNCLAEAAGTRDTVRLKSYGWRYDWLSMYPNITRIVNPKSENRKCR